MLRSTRFTRFTLFTRFGLWGVLLVLAGPGSSWAADPLDAPCTGSWDWVQLESAEWLKGELRRMRTRTFEFESEKLKSQTLEWDDVATVCLAGVARFVRSDRTTVQGIGQVDDGQVRVLTANGEVEFARDELLAILPGRASERERWSLDASLGGDAYTGNTQQASLNASLVVRREDHITRGELGFYGSYGTADGQANANRHRAEFKIDWFLTKRLYATPLDATLQYDEFQNVSSRFTPGSGFGYRVVDRSAFEWDLEAALGYQYLRYISVIPGEPPENQDAVARFSTYFKWTIVSDLDLTVNHSTILVVTNLGQTTNYTRAKLSYEITDRLDLDTTAIHNRTWQPVPNLQGEVPQADDLQLIFGLSIEIW